jgi:hypothetical protein
MGYRLTHVALSGDAAEARDFSPSLGECSLQRVPFGRAETNECLVPFGQIGSTSDVRITE